MSDWANKRPDEFEPAVVDVINVTHQFGAVTAVEDVSFQAKEGEFLAIVGPSGCGKTTVLNMAAGLVQPTGGSVKLWGEEVSGPSTGIGYMTARDGLLPWRSALKNVGFGLEFRGVDKITRNKRSRGLLEMVGLSGFEDSYRSQLSQGIRQHVALARTLALQPQLFLLDEPFAALDAQTRMVLQDEFIRIWEETPERTVILVTHDISEAVALSDRVIVFSGRPGRIKATIDIPLPRPRELEEIRFSGTFVDLVEEVWSEIKE